MKKSKKNKKKKSGFTLVELLAIIVILGVVSLIGVTAIGGIVKKVKINTLKDDALTIIHSCENSAEDYSVEEGEAKIFDITTFGVDNENYIGQVAVVNNAGTYNCSIYLYDKSINYQIGTFVASKIVFAGKAKVKPVSVTYSLLNMNENTAKDISVNGVTYSSDGEKFNKASGIEKYNAFSTCNSLKKVQYENTDYYLESDKYIGKVIKQDKDYIYLLRTEYRDVSDSFYLAKVPLIDTDMIYYVDTGKKFDATSTGYNSSYEYLKANGFQNSETANILGVYYRTNVYYNKKDKNKPIYYNISDGKTDVSNGTYSCYKIIASKNSSKLEFSDDNYQYNYTYLPYYGVYGLYLIKFPISNIKCVDTEGCCIDIDSYEQTKGQTVVS